MVVPTPKSDIEVAVCCPGRKKFSAELSSVSYLIITKTNNNLKLIHIKRLVTEPL